MTGASLRIDERITVDAAPSAVWAALAGPGQPSWWPGMALDARPGGSFREVWSEPGGAPQVTSGSVLRCEPARLLVMTWQDDGWPASTTVTISLEAVGGERTEVRLVHDGWAAVTSDPATCDALIGAHRDGWRHHLSVWAATAGRMLQ